MRSYGGPATVNLPVTTNSTFSLSEAIGITSLASHAGNLTSYHRQNAVLQQFIQPFKGVSGFSRRRREDRDREQKQRRRSC